MTIVTTYFPTDDYLVLDGVEYHYAWGWQYRRSPDHWSDADWSSVCSDHATFGYQFDGSEYCSYYYDESPAPDSFGICQCPGPDAPPLQGPPPSDHGHYWLQRAARFVYDEVAELALRDQQRARRREQRELHARLHTPGYAWCEFA